MCGLAALGVSGAIALRDKPFRKPETGVALAQVDRKELAAVPVQGATRTQTSPSGPAIIKVDPDAAEAEAKGVAIIRDPSALHQNPRIAHIPDRALIEDSPEGSLPIRSADGRRPFDVYARPWSGARGARVAIVVGGLGVSQTGTQQAIQKLPPEVTLAFASQGNSVGRWMQEARREGHEIVLQLPLEPFDYPNVNPGRNTLTTQADAAQNLKNLRAVLGRTTNYTGVMNYMGARFSADRAAFEPVMAELGKRGLLYLDDGTSARSLAPELARGDNVPFASADAVIDGQQDRAAILSKLDELERIARAKGAAVGTGSAFDVTVDAVAAWVQEARRRGIEIVPISALANDPERG